MKKILFVSLVFNAYFLFIICIPLDMPFQFGGGRVLNLPEKGLNIGLGSYEDWLGINKHYALSFSKPEDDGIDSQICDFIIFKPPTVLPWGSLRGNENALRYDEATGEVVIKLPHHTIKVLSEWLNHENLPENKDSGEGGIQADSGDIGGD